MILGSYIGLGIFLIFLFGHWILLTIYCLRNTGRSYLIKQCLLVSLIAISSIIYLLYLNKLIITEFLFLPIIFSYLTFFCLYVLYMPFFYTISASLSVQTLILLLRNESSSASLIFLRSKFASHDLINGRLNIMKKNNFLSLDIDGFYHLKIKGQITSYFFNWLKIIWKLLPGG